MLKTVSKHLIELLLNLGTVSISHCSTFPHKNFKMKFYG